MESLNGNSMWGKIVERFGLLLYSGKFNLVVRRNLNLTGWGILFHRVVCESFCFIPIWGGWFGWSDSEGFIPKTVTAPKIDIISRPLTLDSWNLINVEMTSISCPVLTYRPWSWRYLGLLWIYDECKHGVDGVGSGYIDGFVYASLSVGAELIGSHVRSGDSMLSFVLPCCVAVYGPMDVSWCWRVLYGDLYFDTLAPESLSKFDILKNICYKIRFRSLFLQVWI